MKKNITKEKVLNKSFSPWLKTTKVMFGIAVFLVALAILRGKETTSTDILARTYKKICSKVMEGYNYRYYSFEGGTARPRTIHRKLQYQDGVVFTIDIYTDYTTNATEDFVKKRLFIERMKS